MLKFLSVAFQHSLPPCIVLPAFHDYVHILRIELNKPRLPACSLARDGCRARTPKGFKTKPLPRLLLQIAFWTNSTGFIVGGKSNEHFNFIASPVDPYHLFRLLKDFRADLTR